VPHERHTFGVNSVHHRKRNSFRPSNSASSTKNHTPNATRIGVLKLTDVLGVRFAPHGNLKPMLAPQPPHTFRLTRSILANVDATIAIARVQCSWCIWATVRYRLWGEQHKWNVERCKLSRTYSTLNRVLLLTRNCTAYACRSRLALFFQ